MLKLNKNKDGNAISPRVAATATILILLPVTPLAYGDSNYNPDGFHECILEHVEPGMSKQAVQSVRQSCAYQNGTDRSGQNTEKQKEPTTRFMSILEAIRQKNPPLRSYSDEEIKALIRNSPEFNGLTDKQFDRFVRDSYGVPVH